jgi:hypothetical protein
MIVVRSIVIAIWAYVLLVAALLGSGIPGQVEAMAINTDGIPLGISLVFWTIPLILFFGFALAGWKDDFATPTSGFLVDWFGAERIANMLRKLRPNLLLMIATGLTGILGVGITLTSHRLAVSLCLSSYFLAVGAGNLYAYLRKVRGRG